MTKQTSFVEQQASFFKDGFFVLKNFLHERELSVAQKEVDALVSSGYHSGCIRPNNTLLPLRWNDRLVELFLSSNDRISCLKQAVDANDLKWISGYVSIKDPFSPPLYWHQDWWCWQHEISFKKSTAQIAVLCYLSPTNELNAALRVLPGSHHQQTSLHGCLPKAHDHHNDQEQSGYNNIAFSDQPEQVTFNLDAGDAVVIDYRLLHGTHANKTTHRRDCIMLTFTPSWKDLPEDIQSHLISHIALPYENEQPVQVSYRQELLPAFRGVRKDLELNRMPPTHFKMAE